MKTLHAPMICLWDHDNISTHFKVGGNSIISFQIGLFYFILFWHWGEEMIIDSIDSHTVPGVSWIQDKYRHGMPGKSVIG